MSRITGSLWVHRTCQRFSSQDLSNRLIMQRDTASHTKQQDFTGACTFPQKQGHITCGNAMSNACFALSFSVC